MDAISSLGGAEARGLAALRLAPACREPGETVGEFVFRRLRHAIMTGRFPPGHAVTIRGLATLLRVSAMPVREAMRRLAAERALEPLDNRRVKVPQMTAARFEALLATRILLETEACARAIDCLYEVDLAELRRLDHEADEALASEDVERTIEANFAFHKRLYQVAPGGVLLPLIESVWLQLGPFMRWSLRAAPAHYRVDRHAEALAAIAARDKPALLLAIERDIRDGMGDWRNTDHPLPIVPDGTRAARARQSSG